MTTLQAHFLIFAGILCVGGISSGTVWVWRFHRSHFTQGKPREVAISEADKSMVNLIGTMAAGVFLAFAMTVLVLGSGSH